MDITQDTQQTRAVALLRKKGMARLSELREAGITATTMSRLLEKGEVVQLGRGLYQLPDAPLEVHHALAEAAKLVPKGVVCLTSALAYHGLTDTIPHSVWMAIGPKEWRPRVENSRILIVRFGPKVLDRGVATHLIESVPVRIYDPAKTVVDLFRYRRRAGQRYQNSTGLNLALEGLREALRQRKATPAQIARYASEAGVWNLMAPYVEAMTANA
jgi:predicted transcriptional regulator of viral defense system